MDPLQALKNSSEVEETFIERAQEIVSETGRSYDSVFIELGMSRDDVRDFMANYYQVTAFSIPEGFLIKQDVLAYISEDSASHYHMAPLYVEDEVLVVGVSNPDNLQMREALNFISTKSNIPYKLVYMLEEDVVIAQQFYQNIEGEVGDALETLESELDAEIAARAEEDGQTKESLEHIEEDAPVTKIVATILRYAVDGGASDIHIEPDPKRVAVRFRVDGELSSSLQLPKNVHMAVVARVKILSSMRLDERRKPQDGRFSATFDDRKIDFRVSILPTNHGEKVVMRILDTGKGVLTLVQSGISQENMDVISRIVKEPYGIILISGPTGSGKSTTLRGMIQEVDTVSMNVMSLEDPVEYNMEGVSQSQVRPEIGYTFARGLRAALRQDPDIVMVGEIRDKETAQLAIQAALTGHLVLSTIHTNNAIGVIPRLIDMGVDPYLIAPTLKMAIAQRLARTLCNSTGKEEEIDASTRARINQSFSSLPKKFQDRIPDGNTLLHPEPTPGCASGYRGRTAVTEVLEVDTDIQELILKNASEEEIFQSARKNGFVTIQEDAMIKALKHDISYEEMNVFSSKLSTEVDVEADFESVDNLIDLEIGEDIMESDEAPTN